MTMRDQIRSYLANAVEHLNTAFDVAGMEGPRVIVVSARDKQILDSILRDLPIQKDDGDPRTMICGVEIRIGE